jgi:hypothetical protein
MVVTHSKAGSGKKEQRQRFLVYSSMPLFAFNKENFK